MNKQQLEQALQNPHMRKMLDVIAQAEGVKHGYNTLFGNQRINSLNAHPNIRKTFKQTDGKINYTTAAGRYQFLNSTWNNLAKRYGFNDFSHQNQDLGAVALIAGRGALQDVLSGNYQAAIQKLGKEWASLPSSTYAQGKRSWDQINKWIGGNQVPQQSEKTFTPKFVDLQTVGLSTYEPEFISLDQIGLVSNEQLSASSSNRNQYQPEFVDLKSIGIE